jgi:hypothetical protein
MQERSEKYWRQLLHHHFDTASITAALDAYANNNTLAIAKLSATRAQIIKKWLRRDFNSSRPDLEAMRDAAVAKMRATEDAIEQMRDGYHAIQTHALLEEKQKAEEQRNQLVAAVETGADYASLQPDDLTPDLETPEPLNPKRTVELPVEE